MKYLKVKMISLISILSVSSGCPSDVPNRIGPSPFPVVSSNANAQPSEDISSERRSISLPEQFIDISFFNENVGWAVSSDKVWKSTNGGSSWSVASTFRSKRIGNEASGMVESQPELEKIQVVSLNRAVVMNFNEGLTRLTANSKEPSVIFPANRALIRGFFFSDSLEGWAVGQTETKPNGMWDAVAYKTVDGGKRWQKIDLPEFHDCNCAFYDVLELPDDSVIFAGDVITTMKNDSNSAKIVEDGNSLEDKVLGHPSSVSISSDVVSVLTSRGNKYLVSFDMGSTWESRQLPGSDDLEALKYLDRTKVLALSGGWIFLSRDGGKSWERSAKPISNVHSLIQMPQSANIYAFGRVFAPINTNRLFDH